MNKKPPTKPLLPSGFIDLLPPEAEAEAAAVGTLMQVFRSFGYRRVKPPMLEFEDTLLGTGPGAKMHTDTFRLMDPVSHRMLGVRADITPQIVRIAGTRLEKDERPLRLCYAGDVLRTRASQQRTERQFTQVGCEIIGEGSVESDIESAVLTLIGLDALGIRNITIDLAWPALVAAATPDQRAALARRNTAALPKDLAALVRAAGPAAKALKTLKALRLTAAQKRDLKTLQAIESGLTRACRDLGLAVSVTIDPAETRGFDYKTGFAFTLFAKGISGALGRGGRYRIGSESAAGFTLYMDTVRKAMPAPKAARAERAAYTDSWSAIRKRQKSGAIVVRGNKKG